MSDKPEFTNFNGTELHRLRPDGNAYEFIGYINRADSNLIVGLLNQAMHLTSGRYKTNNVSLPDAIDLILDQAQFEIEVGTDGRCKRLRDFYVQVGIASALRCVLSPDEKSADDLILERFLDAAESPEERAAISEGQLNRPLLLALHHEHQNAIRSVLINEIKHNHGLIAEILAAAETGV